MGDDLSEKIGFWVQKLFFPLVGVVAIVVIASLGWNFKKNKDIEKLTQEQDQLFSIRKEVEKVAQSLEPKEEETKKSADKKAPEKVKAKLSPEVLEKAYTPVVEKLQAYVRANQGTQPAVEAALLVTQLTQDYNKLDMAADSLKTALNGLKPSLFLFGVGQTELGNVYAKSNRCDEAVQAWEQVFNQKEHSYLAGNLRLKSGVCYEKLAQFDKAEKLYQEVIDKEPTSFSGRTAKKFLLHVKFLKSKSTAGQEPSKIKNG